MLHYYTQDSISLHLPLLLTHIYGSLNTPPYLFFFFLMIGPPPRSTLFPYTPLFRSGGAAVGERGDHRGGGAKHVDDERGRAIELPGRHRVGGKHDVDAHGLATRRGPRRPPPSHPQDPIAPAEPAVERSPSGRLLGAGAIAGGRDLVAGPGPAAETPGVPPTGHR